MGRRNKKYRKSLHDQCYEKLGEMMHIGESKKEAKADGSMSEKIFSYETYQNYFKHIKYFIKYVEAEHPEVTTLAKAKPYVKEWLEMREAQGLSAWTLSLENQALIKLYDIKPDDPNRYEPPKRRRSDIKRSRVPTKRENMFSKTNNHEFICFCKGIGLRTGQVLHRLKGEDLWDKSKMEQEVDRLKKKGISALDSNERTLLNTLEESLAVFTEEDYFVYHHGDKGGRDRFAPVIGPDKDMIIERFRNTPPDQKVWLHVPTKAPIHKYRAEYCTALYRKYARNIEDIPYDRVNVKTGIKYKSQVYYCRGDEKGKRLDKEALKKATVALGHGRLDVVPRHYIRSL